MSAIKDYYASLGIGPSATLTEIKKAYRKLAQQHHPDKNNNDPYSAAQFAEIKEAYEVLTNPSKKEYYLQQRWYNQSAGRRKTQGIITPVTVLKQALELEKYVSTLDEFRMDKHGLQEYILEMLPEAAIGQLHHFDEKEPVREIIGTIIKAMHPLPKNYTDPVISRLRQLAGNDSIALQLLNDFSSKTARKYRKERYSLIIIITVTVILCLLIWLAGR